MRDRLSGNNNGYAVRTLARRSIKSSRMRNIFVILTIALSVSLLMVMALFYAGYNTAAKRQAETMQQVIYYGLSAEQLSEMAAEDEPTSYVLGMKQGQGVEIDGNMVSPVAYGSEPLKDEGVGLEMISPIKGRMPAEEDEILLSDVYCSLSGVSPEPGGQVSFTWLDGTTEEYTLSGVYHTEGQQTVYSVVFSGKYAENGSQLKDVPWQGAVCLRDAEDMTRSEFEDAAYSFGREFGVDRRNVNINDYFLEVLSGGEMQTQEAVTVIGLGTGILLVSVLVIYSVFYLSVAGRVRQFGQLRTIGMTRRQIRRMVRIEGLILCAVGIPAGLAVGGLISYLIRPSGWSWLNMLLISACVTAADIVTVLCSVRRPAKIAASISPVDAARYNGYSTDTGAPERRKRKDGEKPARRITPGSLAVMSSFRNKKKTALTMISLGIGGVLYMLAAFYVSSTDEEEYARQGEFAYGEFVISYSYNLSETAEYGEMQLRVEQPLDDVLADRIRDLDGVEEVLPVEKVPVLWEADGDSGNDWTGVLSEDRTERLLDMEHQGQISYADMAENGQIIAVGGEQWEEVYGWELEPGDDVTFHWYDGQDERQRTFEVAAVVDRDDFVRASDALPGERTLSFLIPDATMKEMMGGTDLTSEFVVKTDMDKADQIEESLCGLLEGYPYLSLDTLRDRILQTESMFTLLYSVIVGLSLFIIAFALINLLNTLITSILTRDHEFAMLQSVGMTRRQLVKMLGAEALMISAGNLFITFALGTAAGYVMIRILRYFGADYMRFTFPVWFFAGYAVFIVLVPILITVYMVRMFQRQTLADRLRRQ